MVADVSNLSMVADFSQGEGIVFLMPIHYGAQVGANVAHLRPIAQKYVNSALLLSAPKRQLSKLPITLPLVDKCIDIILFL